VAFARLLEGHYMVIYKIAYKWCGRREDAEDVAQNVCLKLADRLAGFRGDSGFTSWLYRITINAAKDYYRTTGKAYRREQAFADGFDPMSDEVAADEQLVARESYAAIHSLPEPIRDAVLLVFGEEMSHKEAAKILGCAETTVSWRIHKARKILQEREHSSPIRGEGRRGA
jgi:RNA polymerase sigma-70 factor (ECF subfamily)